MKTFSELAVMAIRNPDNRTVDVCIGHAIDLIAYGDIGIRKSVEVCGLDDLARDADDQGCIWFNKLPRYTSSYDAIMTLVVPGSTTRIEHGLYDNGTAWAYVHMVGPAGEFTGEAEADGEIVALLSAMLRARATNPEFIKGPVDDALIVAGAKANRYTVEEQVDGTHAIFRNGGFVKGGFKNYERSEALAAAGKMADEDEEAGVPVMARAE